jgi:hypothetical protein
MKQTRFNFATKHKNKGDKIAKWIQNIFAIKNLMKIACD